jgi:hypothetical protein
MRTVLSSIKCCVASLRGCVGFVLSTMQAMQVSIFVVLRNLRTFVMLVDLTNEFAVDNFPPGNVVEPDTFHEQSRVFNLEIISHCSISQYPQNILPESIQSSQPPSFS